MHTTNFYAYCFGGGVAFQVAAYFKTKHQVDITVFADRSYSSLFAASTNLVAATSGLPLWYSYLMSRTFLYAAGELNLDSVAAIKKLNPKCVFYLNLSEYPESTQSITLFNRVKIFFGIGETPRPADVILRDDATLACALKEVPSCDTSNIFRRIGFTEAPRIFSAPTPTLLATGHFVALHQVQFHHATRQGNGFQLYCEAVKNNDKDLSESKTACKI